MIIGFIPSILRSAIMIKCCFHHILLTFSECSLIAATSRTCGPTPPTADFPHPYNNNNNRPWSGGWLWMAMDGYGWLWMASVLPSTYPVRYQSLHSSVVKPGWKIPIIPWIDGNWWALGIFHPNEAILKEGKNPCIGGVLTQQSPSMLGFIPMIHVIILSRIYPWCSHYVLICPSYPLVCPIFFGQVASAAAQLSNGAAWLQLAGSHGSFSSTAKSSEGNHLENGSTILSHTGHTQMDEPSFSKLSLILTQDLGDSPEGSAQRLRHLRNGSCSDLGQWATTIHWRYNWQLERYHLVV